MAKSPQLFSAVVVNFILKVKQIYRKFILLIELQNTWFSHPSFHPHNKLLCKTSLRADLTHGSRRWVHICWLQSLPLYSCQDFCMVKINGFQWCPLRT